MYLYIRSCCQFIDFVSPIQTVDPVTKIRFLIASTATNVDTKSKIIFECSVVDSQHNIHNLETDDTRNFFGGISNKHHLLIINHNS